MRYFTGQRGKSRLQGHRKRRRVPKISPLGKAEVKIDLLEYKTIRQYQTMADVVERLKDGGPYGFESGLAFDSAAGNGYDWLTKEE